MSTSFTFNNRLVASKAGRTSMGKLSEESKTALAELGGNSLLQQQGIDYYRSLGRRSVEIRRARRKERTQEG